MLFKAKVAVRYVISTKHTDPMRPPCRIFEC